MKFSTLFSRVRKSPATTRRTELDILLLKSVRRHSIPNWRQARYISKLLSAQERYVVLTALGIAAAMLVVMVVGFFSRHLFSVPAAGGEYTEALVGQPKFINPIFSSANDVDADITSLVYAGLFRYNGAGELEPYLADSYTLSSDNKVYTVHIRPNLTWSDGQPLTADDVIYTFELIQNPEVASPLLPSFQGVKVEKIDEENITFTLKSPFAPFLHSLTVGIIPTHIWQDYAANTIRLAKNNLQPVGAGPWQFAKLTKDAGGVIQTYTLTANPTFFGTKPYFKTVQFKFYNDYNGATDALREQQVSALSFLPHDPKNKLSNRIADFFSLNLPQYTALFFNQTQTDILKDAAVRAALAEAISKDDIVNQVLDGNGKPIDGPLVPGSIGYSTSSKKIEYNPTDAESALDKKWPRLSPEDYFKTRHDSLLKEYTDVINNTSSTASGEEPTVVATSTIEDQIAVTVRREMNPDQPYFRKSKDGTILSLTITTADTPEYIKIANSIAAAWRKIGVVAGVQIINSSQISHQVLRNRSFQVLLYGELVGLDSDLFPFWHSSQVSYPGLNIAEYSNRTVDKLLENARETIDTTARAELYKKLQDTLTNDLPAVFLYQPTHTFAVSKDIHGVTLGPLDSPTDRYASFSTWYTKTKWQWK